MASKTIDLGDGWKLECDIEALKESANEMERKLKAIYMLLVCVGGPLNDNKYGYNKEQMSVFSRIEKIIDGEI